MQAAGIAVAFSDPLPHGVCTKMECTEQCGGGAIRTFNLFVLLDRPATVCVLLHVIKFDKMDFVVIYI